MKLIVDISRYQESIDAKILKEAGVEMVVVKSSSGSREDPFYRRHAEAVLEGGLKLGAYHWVDPIESTAKQTDAFFVIAGLYPLTVVWNDFEQWWSNWGEWYTNGIKAGRWAAVKAFGGSRISDAGRTFNELVKAAGYDVHTYTSAGFVREHSPQSANWMKDYPVVAANYPRFGSATNWEQFWKVIAPEVEKQKPVIPLGTTKLSAWQFTGDRYLLPGTYRDPNKRYLSAIDLSVMYDPPIDLSKPEPAVPDTFLYQMVVKAYALTVRNLPNGAAVRYVRKGDKVNIYEEFGAWVRIGQGEWVVKKWLG